MNTILDFYHKKIAAPAGTFDEILEADDSFWETCHGHIQYVFPLPEPSQVQPESPVATQADYDAFAASPILKMRVLAALGRYIAFLDRTTQWRRACDHNHLRITRAIRCLVLCGMNESARDFFKFVDRTAGDAVSEKTVWYWAEALKRYPAWL